MPSGRNDHSMNRNRDRTSRRHSFRSRSTASNTVPASSLSNDWEDVNMADPDSIWDYCINGLDQQLPDDTNPAMLQFVHAV